MRWPLWDGVGEMQIFPADSPVLRRRDGYRDLLTLFRELHTARKPLFDELSAALPARDVATLYEIWAFFRLAADLTRCLGYWDQPMLMLRSAPDMGLGWHTAADLGDGWKLVYNRSYRGGRGSYSLGLRPDYTLQHRGQPEVVLDAKFKFDEKALLPTDDAPMDDRDRDVKAVDLYKMHTYRDALGIRAAVVVYPGDVSRFYPVTGGGQVEASLEALVASSLEGIGAISLVPEEAGE